MLAGLPYGIGPKVCRGVPDSADLREALSQFAPLYQGKYFEVLRRNF